MALVLLASGGVLAFAVSSQWSTSNPIKMFPGESIEIIVILQNEPGPDDIIAKAAITEGGDIAKLVDPDKEYSVPIGERTELKIRITIPETIEIGGTRNIKLSLTTLAGTAPGSLGFGTGIDKIISVNVIKEPEPETKNFLWVIYLIVGILIVVALIIIMVKKRKNAPASKPKKAQ